MRTIVYMAVLLAAGAARAQQGEGGSAAQQGGGGSAAQRGGGNGARADRAAAGATSEAFDRACEDLLHGRMPDGEKAIRTLEKACADLVSSRADERIRDAKRRQAQAAAREQSRLSAEGRGAAQAQPGQSSAPAQEGQGVLAAFGQAASELAGRGRGEDLGVTRRGPVSYSLFTNPIGWFSGLGVNAQLFHAFEDAPRFSWVAGARYAAADATNGTANTFGAMGGVDWFILGGNNEGLRVGPRVEIAAGRERFGGGETDTNTFARLGMSGEIGYNFLATNGISAMAAVGVGGRVAGDDENDDFASFVGGEFGPYLSVGLGYSW
ncbi:MAG TPA: hypothetical protein VFL83_07275 [Anaeromyxobacter sp.]|nr:hypothetical protein [Anaeromyxobacter sp.]